MEISTCLRARVDRWVETSRTAPAFPASAGALMREWLELMISFALALSNKLKGVGGEQLLLELV